MPCFSGRVQIFTGEGNQRGRFRVTELASSFIRSGRTPSTATPLTPMRSVSTLACFHWCFHAIRARDVNELNIQSRRSVLSTWRCLPLNESWKLSERARR